MKKYFIVICLLIAARTSAQTTIATDTFVRTSEDPLSGNWAIATALAGYQIQGNHGIPSSLVATYAWTYNTTGGFAQDQFSQATLSVYANNVSAASSVACRMQTGAHSGYEAIAYNGNYLLIKRTAGAATTTVTLVATPSANDVIRLECTGSTTTTCIVKINGSTDANTLIDGTSPWTTGGPGVGGVGTASITALNTWSGGNTASAATVHTFGSLGVGK